MTALGAFCSGKLSKPIRGNLWPQIVRFSSTLVSSAPLEPYRKKRSLSRWTAAEKETMRSGILADKTIWELCNEFPDRNFNSVRAAFTRMRSELGKSYKRALWSKEEAAVLKHAKGLGTSWCHIQAMFPKRSYFDIVQKWRGMVEQERAFRGLMPCTDEQGVEIVHRRDKLGHTFHEIAVDRSWTDQKVKEVYRDRKAWSPAAPVASPKWRDAEVRELIRLHDSGMAPNAIADVIGRSGPAVVARLIAMNGVGEKILWRKEDLHKLERLRVSGLSWEEISHEIPTRTTLSLKNAYYRHVYENKRSAEDTHDGASEAETNRHVQEPVEAENEVGPVETEACK